MSENFEKVKLLVQQRDSKTTIARVFASSYAETLVATLCSIASREQPLKDINKPAG